MKLLYKMFPLMLSWFRLHWRKVAFVLLAILSVVLLTDKISTCAKKPASTNFIKINDFVGASGKKFVSEDEIIEKAKQLIKVRDARVFKDIKQLNDATYLIKAYSKTNKQADFEYRKEGGISYLFHEVHLPDQNGKQGPAIGYVMIYPNGKFVSKVYDFKVKVNTVIKDDVNINSADLYMQQAGLSNRKDSTKVNWVGLPYNLPIVDAGVLINENNFQKDKILFYFRLDLGVNNVVTVKDFDYDIVPTLGFSFINWGNEDRLKYRFLRLGVGGRNLDNGVMYSVSPIMFNLNNVSSLFHNTFIGPNLGYDKRGVNLGALLALTF